jgi:DNA-binding beta-propeller fold protein YncE
MITLLLALACRPATVEPDPIPPAQACTPGDPPAEATRRYGWQDDTTFVSAGGRVVQPAGPTAIVSDSPQDAVAHPTGPWVYVLSTGNSTYRVTVLDRTTAAVLQDVILPRALHGLRLTPDGRTLLAAGGLSASLLRFAVGDDGLLTQLDSVPVPSTRVAGMALSADGARVWVGTWDDHEVVEIDLATSAIVRSIPVEVTPWDIVRVPGREELYVSDITGSGIAVVDLATHARVATVPLPAFPAGMAARSDGTKVYVAASGTDHVARIDTATRTVDATAPMLDDQLTGPDGLPLGRVSVNALWLDEAQDRLFASRGIDNAVSVIQASTMVPQGAVPTPDYPSAITLAPDGHTLVVGALRGGGVGPTPDTSAKDVLKGAVSFINLDTLDLAAATADVARLFSTPIERFPRPCAADTVYPVPEAYDGGSPIEHVVLVVKENKTFDCVFGDIGEALGADVAPDLLRWGADLTPNMHALATTYATSDAFFVEALESDSGHLFLTTGHWTELTARMWAEYGDQGPLGWQLSDAVTPTNGNLFTWAVDHGRTLKIYGEIVGFTTAAADGTPIASFSDPDYPGGPAINYGVPDVDKAQYIVEQTALHGLANLTYVSFPNDHTAGTSPGIATPESMVADNDAAVGILVAGLSSDPERWRKTAVFILQDDPQGCNDHVDGSRSVLVVASPWSRGQGTSHVNVSFLSVFATLERLLGLPPMGRADAVAAPLWDMFSGVPDDRAYAAIPRTFPPEVNPEASFAGDLSGKLDLRGPDRDPRLYAILEPYRQWKMGRISRAEAERRLRAPRYGLDEETWEELTEEAEHETTAFDLAWKSYADWMVSIGRPRPVQQRLPAPAAAPAVRPAAPAPPR